MYPGYTTKRHNRMTRLLCAVLALVLLALALLAAGCAPAAQSGAQPPVTPLPGWDEYPIGTPIPLVHSTPAPLLEVPEELTAPEETPGSGASMIIDTTAVLQEGAEHAVVAEIQERLMALGYFDHDEITQHYGPATASAIRLFQRVQGMEQTGVADGFLQSLILYEDCIAYHMKQGDEGEDVAAMQARLKELGYFRQKESGLFGEDTLQSVLKFQQRNKLEQTGTMDVQALNLLYSFDARPRVDPTPSPTPKPQNKKGVEGLIEAANAQKGKKYVWGGNGPDTFDCSGFLYYCLTQVGMGYIGRVKAVHYSQFKDWEEVRRIKDLKRGDFIFFKSDKDDVVSHTGIYLGDNKFIHASFSAGKVKTDYLTGYFERNFVNGRRVFD